jgi:hypothetical protein
MRVVRMFEEVRFSGHWERLEQRKLNKCDFNGMISRKCSSQPQIDTRLH